VELDQVLEGVLLAHALLKDAPARLNDLDQRVLFEYAHKVLHS